MKLLWYTIVFSIVLEPCFSKEFTTTFSKPLDISSAGWNKLLVLDNGNTILFHLEPALLTVKIFDGNGKELVTRSFDKRHTKFNWLNNCKIKGLYEINGEAVLFVEYELLNSIKKQKGLARIRFNELTGWRIHQEKIMKSTYNPQSDSYFILKDKSSAEYSVFCLKTIVGTTAPCEFYTFNVKHKIVSKIPLTVRTEQNNFITVLATGKENGDVFIALSLSRYNRIVANKERAVYQHSIVFASLARAKTSFVMVYDTLPRLSYNSHDGPKGRSYNNQFPICSGDKTRPNGKRQPLPACLINQRGGLVVISENYFDNCIGDIIIHKIASESDDVILPRYIYTEFVTPSDVLNGISSAYEKDMTQRDGVRWFVSGEIGYIFFNSCNINGKEQSRHTALFGYSYSLTDGGHVQRQLPFDDISSYNTCYLLESLSFNEKHKVFVGVIQVNNGASTLYKVAWSKVG